MSIWPNCSWSVVMEETVHSGEVSRRLKVCQQAPRRDRSQPADQARPRQPRGLIRKCAVWTQAPEHLVPRELEHGYTREDENHLDVERRIDQSLGRTRH